MIVGGARASAAAFDLTGTWHVLVHYKDTAAGNPEAERWEDRLWVFAREEGRLRWTDYPIVVLQDESGRFDRLGTNRASRALHYWTPNAGQAAELAAGPTVNSRGSKSKALSGSDEGGWKSTASQPRAVGFITYEETWSVEPVQGLPVFTRLDVLGGATAEESEGRTRYQVTQVEEGGRVLRGSYDRDGTRSGSFTLTRSGPVRMLAPAPEEHQRERLREHFGDQLGRDLGLEDEEGE